MAIYHFSAQLIQRSSGQSAVAAAAYRAGEQLTDERTGEVHDYTPRTKARDMDMEAVIIAPEDAPEWARDRERLWNRVEATEKREDATVSREINAAIPAELTRDQAREAVLAYVRKEVEETGKIIDVSFHWKEGNPHVHMQETQRPLLEDGDFGLKERSWEKKNKLYKERENWAREMNRALEKAGHEARIDHRSLDAQGEDREPQIHLGSKPGPERTAQNDAIKRRNAARKKRKTPLEAKAGAEARRHVEKAIQEVAGEEGKDAVKAFRAVEKAGEVLKIAGALREALDARKALAQAYTDSSGFAGRIAPRSAPELAKEKSFFETKSQEISKKIADFKARERKGLLSPEEIKEAKTIKAGLFGEAKEARSMGRAVGLAERKQLAFQRALDGFGKRAITSRIERLATEAFGPEVKTALKAYKFIRAAIKTATKTALSVKKSKHIDLQAKSDKNIKQIFDKLAQLKGEEATLKGNYTEIRDKYAEVKKMRFENVDFLKTRIEQTSTALEFRKAEIEGFERRPFRERGLKDRVAKFKAEIIKLEGELKDFEKRLGVASANNAKYPKEIRQEISRTWKGQGNRLRAKVKRATRLRQGFEKHFKELATRALEKGPASVAAWQYKLGREMLRMKLIDLGKER